MIYWYSGTGNSRYVAKYISSALDDGECRFIPAETGDLVCERRLSESGVSAASGSDRVGFCFPVYSWGVPPIVMRFIEEIDVSILQNKYVYVVMTCGDEAGLAGEMCRKALLRRGVRINALFTVIMPNDYVMLPGFDIDSKEVENKKLQEADVRLGALVEILKGKGDTEDVYRGSFAWLKTKVVYPLFRRWGVQTRRWKVDKTKCIGCGKCERQCPAGNISLVDSFPEWGGRCYSCTACFHICPVRAIDYGSFTKGKRQYFCPKK